MPAHVRDEVDADAAGPLVVQVAVESQRGEVALEFLAQEGCGLAAAGVAGFLAAHQDEVFVGAGAGFEGGGGWGGGYGGGGGGGD